MKICWPNALLILVIVVLGTLSMLSACGRKGDLYLPDKTPASSQDTQKQ
jgi:predicted small lipoprotein YifL